MPIAKMYVLIILANLYTCCNSDLDELDSRDPHLAGNNTIDDSCCRWPLAFIIMIRIGELWLDN
jgi:hypothetical protein